MIWIIINHDGHHGYNAIYSLVCVVIIRSFISLLFFLALILALSGCRNTPTVAQTQRVAIDRPEPLFIPADSSYTFFGGLTQRELVLEYYRNNNGNPAWLDERNSPFAGMLISMLGRIQYYGFAEGSYHYRELGDIARSDTRAGLIRKDVLLTDAFFSLAHDLRYGVGNSRADSSLRIGLLDSALATGNIISALEAREPAMKGYTSLKEGLRLMLDSLEKKDTTGSISWHQDFKLIAINLERWRRESENISERYIFVNIPSFSLDVVENDSIVLTSRVIVGTPKKQTPVLSGMVECFTVYPYWHVPRSISVEEYLPVIKKDTAFITRNNFDVLDRRGRVLNADTIPWGRFSKNYFPVVLRQREGPDNSLGVIKFIFDNPHAVFLHDTNARRLFNNKTRALSHGCVRMEKAVELAHFLVTGVVGGESKYVTGFLKEKSQHWVDLKKPIPIYLRYFTCEFRNNRLVRYDDVYSLDQPLYDLMKDLDKDPDI